MRKNVLLWPMALALIAASWIGNVAYYRSMQLPEPKFFKHYYAVSDVESERIELMYAENLREGRKVRGVRIEELPQLQFELYESGRYPYQALMTAAAKWDHEQADPLKTLPLTVREATVYYSEGPPQKVPIGEIRIMPQAGEPVLQFISGGSSSGGTGEYLGQVEKPARLEQIDYTYSSRLKPWLTLELSGQPVELLGFPVMFDAEDSFDLKYRFDIPEDDPAALEVYKLKGLLTFRTEDGRTVTEQIPINSFFSLSDRQMKRFVRSEGGI